eukprot:CAMPEP_0185755604 /NCGR_PEP_ID=MMETSP1174-20130828/14084_1 /TAXON_ID=35687 /ORGANISM="Dictyocha speculum, Strain CCMP1381" /LENGTH=251 /DNA_ID=CAMNT_0028434227 /DNA_START=36 /DNA_END=791 /DNA_ORIENTATION=+
MVTGDMASEDGTGGDNKTTETERNDSIAYNVGKWNKKGTGIKTKSGEDMIDMIIEWLKRFPLVSLEDPFDDSDAETFMKFKERFDAEAALADEHALLASQAEGGGEPAAMVGEEDEGQISRESVGNDPTCRLQLVGNATCTTVEDMDRCNDKHTLNTVTLTLAKGQTVTGCIAMCQKAKVLGWCVIVSFEETFSETTDDFVAHLAVGVKAGQFKAGGLRNAEHMCKYNELLRIATSDEAPSFVGSSFRKFP